ncbi:MAG TPA: hypothetical protein GXX29_03915 [Firmicutes bacterium]|nr:hypothetical protein [Bacillota bacterium]
MRLHIMGSAAAEGWPAMWCDCPSCHKAHQAGGKNYRTRSGALIDGVIKVDLCPDTYMQARRDDVDLSKVTDLLITHAHQDHFTPAELGFHVPPFAHGATPLHVWAALQAIMLARAATQRWPDVENRLHVLTPLAPVRLSDGITEVLPLPARHDRHSGPLNYIITRNGKSLFYGLDSGWYPDESWEAQKGNKFAIVVLDCTHGDMEASDGHGSLGTAKRIKEEMLAAGTADHNTVFIANHFSHNGGLLHEEMEDIVRSAGILVGYDGMIVEV